MDSLPTLDDVYRKFGEASEAAQLLETELGTLLFGEQAIAEDLLGGDGKRATEIMMAINRQTLGTLIKNAKGTSPSIEEIARASSQYLYDADWLGRGIGSEIKQQRSLRRGSTLKDL